MNNGKKEFPINGFELSAIYNISGIKKYAKHTISKRFRKQGKIDIRKSIEQAIEDDYQDYLENLEFESRYSEFESRYTPNDWYEDYLFEEYLKELEAEEDALLFKMINFEY